MKKALIIPLSLLVLFTINATGQMLKTSGVDIVDDSGRVVILKGLNTNNWLLQEGYMMNSGRVSSHQDVEEAVRELVGEDSELKFYDEWRANYFTKGDIDSMAAWGFNSVRAAFHYKWLSPRDSAGVYLEKGFVEFDSLVSWCAANRMWVIFDMHGAPGGQGRNSEISDYNPEKCSLYESEENQKRFAEIWQKIAERFKDNPWVAGYDLANEPNWNFDVNSYNSTSEAWLPGCTVTGSGPHYGYQNPDSVLPSTYQRAIDSIRKVDTNHMIIVEGNWYANSWSPTLRSMMAANDNIVFSFHKYWSDVGFGWMLDYRRDYNVPLWLGETGENSNQWFIQLVEECERHGVGWAWWGTKKIGSISSIFEVPHDAKYDVVSQYWRDGGTAPDSAYAMEALLAISDSSNVANCSFNMDMVYSLVGNPGGDATYPYKEHNLPGEVMATDFDMGAVGEALYDVDYANFGKGFYNQGWAYRNSGTDISADNDFEGNGYHVGWTEPSEWMKYTVNVDSTGWYKVTVRAASDGEGKFTVSTDSGSGGSIDINSTGGFNAYSDMFGGFVYLEKGQSAFYFTILEGGFDVNKFTFQYEGLVQSTNELLDRSSMVIAPNPTEGQISISASVPAGNYAVKLIDLTGRVLTISDAQFYSNSLFHKLDLAELNLTSGTYLVMIEGENGGRIVQRVQYMK